ncbi:Basement membrane-specific heparan sulfate proteoglycan core protein [Operophtera brumata]|uniref:Basement membrane-specific heparan sulfate proteoglycan core protein n=1 Tax=Operophtera brumata TaxID=104452 RepID=A0A0L7L1G1_OPEBR|nr:Basement membrane-specific heparan sulfate proteoglycan core protein [Operophtera brumata]
METPMFVGGVDENIVLNSNTGVSSGFMGCIKDVENNPCRCNNGGSCSSEGYCVCPPGFSGYYCETRLASSLRFSNARPPTEPCAARPCRNGGTCRPDYSNMMNHTCDCPLGFSGATCQMREYSYWRFASICFLVLHAMKLEYKCLDLYQSVGFNGNGYLELPANLVSYEDLESEPALIALRANTMHDGVLAFQRETLASPDTGDYLLIRSEFFALL